MKAVGAEKIIHDLVESLWAGQASTTATTT